MKTLRLFCFFLLVFLLSSCSIELSPASATLPPNKSTPAITVPVTWANLGLSGKLVYTTAQQDGNIPSMDIRILDLASGEITVLFRTPPAGIIYIATVSPDTLAGTGSSQIIFAYSLPPGANNSAPQELYIMPLDGSQPPQLFLTPPSADDEYFQPDWSPDSKTIYFSHVNYHLPPQPGQHYPIYELYRMSYPDGAPQKLIEQAYWPRISADGSRLAYVSLDPLTGKNRLFLANADGSNAAELTLSGPLVPDIIDAPLFSPDGMSLLFSAPVPGQAYEPAPLTWFEKLLGITVALAHAVPSEWWSVPLTGGTPTQLTHIQMLGLFGSVSPDKKYIASYSGDGIFVMAPDGTGLTMLINDVGGMPGTVSWIP